MHFTPYAWNADRHRDVHGTTTVRLRSRWHNWLDEQRTWRAIEIAPAMRGGRQFRVAKAPYLLEAPLFADGEAQFQSTNLYDIWKKQHRADFPAGIVKRYPSAAKVRGEALAASVLYSGAFPALSADRLIQFSTQCVRDLVVFYQQPAGDGPVEIPVEIEFGSLPILESRGRGRQAVEGDFRKERSFRHGLTFTTSRFRGVQIEPPQAWDSSGKRISITLAGRVVGNRFVGRKVIPRSFFRDAVYPVYADTTETFYPSPDAAATTIDGVVSRLTVSGESWASLQGGNGTTQNSTNTSMDALLTSDSTSNEYTLIQRPILLFDTSSLPDTATITSAALKLYVQSVSDEFTDSIVAVASSPASNTALAASDYQTMGSTALSSAVSLLSLTTSAYNSLALNATGISAISLSGITKLGVRLERDRANSEPTWHSVGTDRVTFTSADDSGTSQSPYLEVTYSGGGMAVLFFRGDAQPRAQVTKVTPGGTIEQGDIFTLTCNRKDISVTAGSDPTVESVVQAFVSAVGQFGNDIPEFAEMSASAGTDDAGNVTHLVLTGRPDGTPFTVTAGTTNASTFELVITVLRAGAAAKNQKQRISLPDVRSGTFTLSFGGATTGALDYDSTAAEITTALEGLSTIGSGNVSVVENATGDWTVEWIDDFDAQSMPLFTGDGSTLVASDVKIAVVQEGRPANYARGPLYTLTLPGDGVYAYRFKYDGGSDSTPDNVLNYYSNWVNINATANDVLDALKSIMVPANLEAGSQDDQPIGELSQLILEADVTGDVGGPFRILIRTLGSNAAGFGTATDADGAGLKLDIDTFYSSPSELVDEGGLTADLDFTAAASTAAVNEIQSAWLTHAGATGTFRLTFQGQQTATIAFDGTNYDVRDALCALSNIAGTDAVRTLTPSGTWSSGTFTLDLQFPTAYPISGVSTATTAAIAYNANAATIQAAIEAVSGVEAGSMVVTGGPLSSGAVTVTLRKRAGRWNGSGVTAVNTGGVGGGGTAAVTTATAGVNADVTVTGSGTPQSPWLVTFLNSLAATDVQTIVVSNNSIGGGEVDVEIVQRESLAVNEQQLIAMIDQPTGGTFTLTFNSETTSAIAYNATAATVRAALEALTTPVPGDFVVTGGPFPASPVTVEFTGSYAGTNVGLISSSGASLTGANTQTFTKSDVTTATGPNHLSNVENYSGGALPSNGDVLIIQNLSSDILWDVDALSAIALAEFHMDASFTGQFGLKPINDINGSPYYEYRTRPVSIQSTLSYCNRGRGACSKFAYIDFGSSTGTTCTVFNTASPDDNGTPALCIKGSNSGHVFNMQKGTWALGAFAGDETNGTLNISYVSDKESDSIGFVGADSGIGVVNMSGGQVEFDLHSGKGASALTTVTVTGGQMTINGNLGISTNLIAMGDCRIFYNSTGTIAGNPVLAGSAVLDFSQDMRTKTVTNPIEIQSESARVHDPFKKVSSLVLDFNYGHVLINEMDLGLNLRLTRGATA